MNVEWKESNPDYIVSSDGKVMSRKWGKLREVKPCKAGNGYAAVLIYIAGIRRLHTVHTLVAEAFLGPRPTPKHQVNHRNGIKFDNRDHNLEWVTPSENSQHRYDVLGHVGPRGGKAGSARFTEVNVREIRSRLARGESPKSIASFFGMSRNSIYDIAEHRTWAWLK